jgi:hypothetical protein
MQRNKRMVLNQPRYLSTKSRSNIFQQKKAYYSRLKYQTTVETNFRQTKTQTAENNQFQQSDFIVEKKDKGNKENWRKMCFEINYQV